MGNGTAPMLNAAVSTLSVMRPSSHHPSMEVFHFIDTLVPNTCAQVAIPPAKADLALINNTVHEAVAAGSGGCGWWETATCAGKIAAAIGGCGVDVTLGIACYAGMAYSMGSCKDCFCQHLRSISGVSCNSLGMGAMTTHPAGLGTCAQAGYAEPAGVYKIKHAPVTGSGIDFEMFKKPLNGTAPMSNEAAPLVNGTAPMLN